MNSLRGVFNDLMRKHHRQGVLLGHTTASTPEDYFGFRPSQVAGIHFHKTGIGEGLWFRLRCGRVVDEVAMATCRDPDLYDQAAG
ncbi:MAG: hypothetical protein LAO55_18360 [Acidobacteriia bacterium]|nr:hypothetical protein [Terriglobia bacterium]